MKRTFRNLGVMICMAGSLSLASCKDGGSKKNAVEMETEKTEATNIEKEEVKSTGMAAFQDEQVAEAYDNYLKLKNALVASDTSKASKYAETLMNDNNTEIASAAKAIQESENINQQRENFSKLTSAMEPILKEALASGKIYKQYCPMAFEGKGDYWYSDSEQIRNPYFGDKMLKCGRVEETIQ